MISLTSKYAIRALFRLAEEPSGRFLPVSQLAKDAHIPSHYLSKLVRRLSERKLLKMKRGVGGGVALVKPETSFFEVCSALDEPLIKETCFLSSKKCSPTNHCSVHEEWAKKREELLEFLNTSIISKT